MMLPVGDSNLDGIRFADLCGLLTHFGFAVRIRGSHHNFRKTGFDDINLQSAGKTRNLTKSNKCGKSCAGERNETIPTQRLRNPDLVE